MFWDVPDSDEGGVQPHDDEDLSSDFENDTRPKLTSQEEKLIYCNEVWWFLLKSSIDPLIDVSVSTHQSAN